MTDDPDLSIYKPWVQQLITGWDRLQYLSNGQIARELLPKTYSEDQSRATGNVRKKIARLSAKGIIAFDQDRVDPEDLNEVEIDLDQRWIREKSRRASTGAYLAKVIRESVEGLPTCPSPVHKNIVDPRGATLVAVVTDVQWGRKTPSYNETIAIERLDKFHDEIERIAVESGAENLVMIYGGDIVDGDQIFPTQPFQITTPAVKQYLSSANYLGQKLVSLSALFGKIDVIGVCGNHGRMRDKGEGYYLNNWDYLVYHHMAQLSINQTKITWTIPEDWYTIFPVRHFNLLITHGDACSGGDGVVSVKKAALKWSAAMQHSWDICLVGHFHTPFWGRVNDKWVGITGSTMSGDDFALRVIKEAVPPSQKILLIREGNKTISVTDVVLD